MNVVLQVTGERHQARDPTALAFLAFVMATVIPAILKPVHVTADTTLLASTVRNVLMDIMEIPLLGHRMTANLALVLKVQVVLLFPRQKK